ncbi:MAG: methylase [Gammaproteobacteria bacterium]|nr:methylase [Gammaproteobacteria bacterium]
MQGFSQAAENNKAAILAVLAEWLPHQTKLLEIGSGAGQHAIHLAAALNHLLWQPSDREIVLPALTSNIDEYGPVNILGPITLDLASHTWPAQTYNCVYAANVMHIVSSELGENLIRGAAKVLTDEGLLALYGPFKYAGDFTSPSNADFDLWLKECDAQSGVRDVEWILDLATHAGLWLVEDRQMPANNQMLIFQKTAD